MSKIIIAISGKKGSGKNTIAEFIHDFFFDENVEVQEFSFADNLKDFCIDTLGLSRRQCYGTDKEKNSSTKYMWENASPFLRWKFGSTEFQRNPGCPSAYLEKATGAGEVLRKKYYQNRFFSRGERTGPMSGRDIMQLFGTELVRENFGNVWADATIRRIEKEEWPVSIITDNRFPSEVEVVLQRERGYIVRLTRNPFGFSDSHPSETLLDDFDWNRPKCFLLDNSEMTILEQNEAITPILEQIYFRGDL